MAGGLWASVVHCSRLTTGVDQERDGGYGPSDALPICKYNILSRSLPPISQRGRTRRNIASGKWNRFSTDPRDSLPPFQLQESRTRGQNTDDMLRTCETSTWRLVGRFRRQAPGFCFPQITAVTYLGPQVVVGGNPGSRGSSTAWPCLREASDALWSGMAFAARSSFVGHLIGPLAHRCGA